MKPIIDQAFWSDPDIEGTKAGVKLAVLWLVTNSQTNLLGICGASANRFTFETGLDSDALESALKALPRALGRFGSLVFVKHYIRHQFGSGEKLMRNNFFTALKSLFLAIRDEQLRDCLLAEYPEFMYAFPEFDKGFEGLSEPQYSKAKEGEEKKGKGRGAGEGRVSGYTVPECFEKVEGFTVGLAAWIESRKKLRKPATGIAIQTLIDRLAERPNDAVEALKMVVERGWTTIKWTWFDRDKADDAPKNGHRYKDTPVRGIELRPEDMPIIE